MNKRVEIPISKTKILILLLGSVVFVFLSVWLLLYSQVEVLIKVICGIGSIFFSLGIYIFIKKIFEKNVGLIIDEKGIIDNMTKPHIGLIEWKDILRVEFSRIMTNKMLMIYVENPEKYLNRIEPSKRRGLNNNYKLIGTPFVIPSFILKMKLADIEKIINKRLDEDYKIYEIPIYLLKELSCEETTDIISEIGELDEFIMGPDVDLWKFSYQGLSFSIIDDIVYDSDISYRCKKEEFQLYTEKAKEVKELIENKIIDIDNARKS